VEIVGSMQLIDYLIVAFYFGVMLVIGVYFSRYMKKLNDYYRGGGKIPWWMAGLSAYMTSFSAFAFVGVASVAYSYGFTVGFMYWSCTVGFYLAARFLAARWKRSGVTTPAEYLEERFGLSVRQLMVWTFIPMRSLDNGMRLYSMSVFFGTAMGIDLRLTIIVSGIVIIVYTMIGGLWAVVITDVIQFVILTVAVLIILPLSLVAVGGVSGLVSGSPPGSPCSRFWRMPATGPWPSGFTRFRTRRMPGKPVTWPPGCHSSARFYGVFPPWRPGS